MATVLLPNSKGYYTQIIIHSATSTVDFYLTRLFQKHLSNTACKHAVIDQGKYNSWASKLNWIEMEYFFQEEDDLTHKNVKIFCDTNQFPSFKFCVPHTNPHGVRGLSKQYHIIFYTKLGHGTCEIRLIACACD